MRSNWVVPGHVLAGDRAGLDEEADLRAVLAAGVTTVVCLQTRQETRAAVDYRRRAAKIQPSVSFLECPIVDQQVAEDDRIEQFVGTLVEHLQQGEILYVHCRGGHGRTGTVCALLLARLYGLGANEALARVQLCHDTRVQPCFVAKGDNLARLRAGDSDACVSLFPVQREQVARLLARPGGAASAGETSLQRWHEVAAEASAAMQRAKAAASADRRSELLRAVEAFREAQKLRPDYARGHVGLARALRLAGEAEEAREVLNAALAQWPEDDAVAKELSLLPEALPPPPQAEPEQAHEPLPQADSWRPLVSAPRFVLLVGLPGSGKSTFGSQLAASGAAWQRICQDELGGRAAVESAIGVAAKASGSRVILDRCNVDADDRRYLLELAFNPEPAVCVFFAASPEDCEARVAARTTHPTIGFGGGRRAVRSMHANLREPRLEEGFQEVITLHNFHEANHLLRCWGAEPPEVPPSGLFPFPKVPQLVLADDGEAGLAALGAPECARLLAAGAALIVEELAGGAVCGISLTPDYELLFQSGSRYVQPQAGVASGTWAGLAEWLGEWEGSLLALLEPEREVLFGEWCPSGSLGEDEPATFIAKDIYNKHKARFCSTRVRDGRLSGSGLQPPPKLAEGPVGKEDVLELLRKPSALCSHRSTHGLQLRVDEPVEREGGLWLESRAWVARR